MTNSATNNAPDAGVEMENVKPVVVEQQDGEQKEQQQEVKVFRQMGPEDLAVGGGIKYDLEEIFGRANEAMPHYESMGKLAGIANSLRTDLDKGIPSDSIAQRTETFGANQLPDEDPLTFWAILLDAWSDHMILILSAAAVVSLILGFTVPEQGEDEVHYDKCWIEGVAILISVFLVTTIASVNDYRKELKFRELTAANSKLDITCIRDGVPMVIDVTEIVVGDLITINPGLVVPVDGLFVKGMSVVIDEASVTGENDPKKKNAENPFFLTGTVVMTAENAWLLVCAVGESSFGGKLLMQSRGEGGIRPTPLQERLDDMADLIGKLGIAAAIILFVTLSIIEAVRFGRDDPKADGVRFLDYFILAVAIICVAVPEGLPLAVTISLAYSQNRMRKDNNQVRRLKACETMGNATTICSDKTGTLTQNLMSVVQGEISGRHFRVANPGEFLEKVTIEGVSVESLTMLCEIIATNSSSVKVVRDTLRDGTVIPPKWVWELDKGNKTDNALLDLIDRIALQPEDITSLQTLPHQRIRAEKLVDGDFVMFPFTSTAKCMSTALRTPDGFIMYLKGGSEEVLARCSTRLDASGAAVPMTDYDRAAINETIRTFASEANRNIGMAYQRLPGDLPAEEPRDNYVWFGVLGIQDPLRPEVRDAVAKCQHAGVVVRMCTGDNLDTAIAISKECGIYKEGDLALVGREFRDLVYDAFAMGDQGAARLTPLLFAMTVLARSQPLDKQMLVLMHMTRGEVVAVTGDGTNDAPALKLANVGFVMRSGTDIAVKSADIVLLDDNFRSVQRAVVWGRTVNDNIRKFLQLQLSVNVVCVLLTFISAVSSVDNESALTTVQLLWVNLIMDTFAAIALATEQPSEDCLDRGPINRKAPLVSRRMMLMIGFQAAYQLTVTLVMQYHGYVWFNVNERSDQHKTVVFNVFVWCTIFNMFNSRKLYQELNIFEGFDRSWPFLIIICITGGIQALAVETFGEFINTQPLTWDQWLGSMLCGIIVWPVCFVQRLIPIPEPVYDREFEPEEMDDEAKTMLENLTAQIEAIVSGHSDAERGLHGSHLASAEARLGIVPPAAVAPVEGTVVVAIPSETEPIYVASVPAQQEPAFAPAV